jgi:hypothetical protein
VGEHQEASGCVDVIQRDDFANDHLNLLPANGVVLPILRIDQPTREAPGEEAAASPAAVGRHPHLDNQERKGLERQEEDANDDEVEWQRDMEQDGQQNEEYPEAKEAEPEVQVLKERNDPGLPKGLLSCVGPDGAAQPGYARDLEDGDWNEGRVLLEQSWESRGWMGLLARNLVCSAQQVAEVLAVRAIEVPGAGAKSYWKLLFWDTCASRHES